MAEHSVAVELKCNEICLGVTIRLGPKAATNNDAQMCRGVLWDGASGTQEQHEELGLTAATQV